MSVKSPHLYHNLKGNYIEVTDASRIVLPHFVWTWYCFSRSGPSVDLILAIWVMSSLFPQLMFFSLSSFVFSFLFIICIFVKHQGLNFRFYINDCNSHINLGAIKVKGISDFMFMKHRRRKYKRHTVYRFPECLWKALEVLNFGVSLKPKKGKGLMTRMGFLFCLVSCLGGNRWWVDTSVLHGRCSILSVAKYNSLHNYSLIDAPIIRSRRKRD